MASAEAKPILEPPAAHTATCFRFPDVAFLAGWGFSVFIMVVLAFGYGIEAIVEADSADVDGNAGILWIFLLALIFATLVAQAWVKVMIKFGSALVNVMFFGTAGIIVFMCIVTASQGLYKFSVIFALVAAAVLVYYKRYHNDFEFAAKTLAVAAKIVEAYPATELVALIMVGVTAAWSFMFGMAAFGMDEYCDEKDLNSFQTLLAWFVVVTIYYWGVQVFKGIVVCTTAGTAAEWWFSRASPRHPTWWAFERAVTVDLGSICFGAFFVAILKALASIMAFVKSEVERVGGTPGKVLGYALCCCIAMVGCLGKCAEWCTEYAYVTIGIYGHGFTAACSHVMDLFKTHGLLIAEQDMVVSLVLLMGTGVVGLTTGAFGALLAENGPDAWTESLAHPAVVSAVVCTAIGLGIGTVCLSVVEAADQAVLISFMEHPKVLETNHPEEHALLASTWKSMGEKEEEMAMTGGAAVRLV